MTVRTSLATLLLINERSLWQTKYIKNCNTIHRYNVAKISCTARLGLHDRRRHAVSYSGSAGGSEYFLLPLYHSCWLTWMENWYTERGLIPVIRPERTILKCSSCSRGGIYCSKWPCSSISAVPCMMRVILNGRKGKSERRMSL